MALRSVITATLIFLTAHSVHADHCDVIDTLDNQWVNVNNLKNDHDTRYLSGAKVSSKVECQQACCQSEKCSVVIFDTKENQPKENCFLLECSQELECIFENKDGMVTYVVDKKHDGEVKEGTPSTSTPGKLTSSASVPSTRTTPKNSTTVKSTTQLGMESVTPTKAPLLNEVSPFITKSPTKPPTTTTRTATTPAPPPPPNATKSTVSPASVLETTATTIGAKPKTTTTVKASVSDAKSFSDQNATSEISQGPSTTTSVFVLNNNSVSNSTNEAENMELDRNNVTSDELTIKEISQLLNITLPGLQVNDSLVNSTIPQIKRPTISTQSFVPLNSSSLSSTSSSTTTTTTLSPSSSSKFVHVSTSQQNKSSVITTKAANINVLKTTTTTTTTTISPMLTNIQELDQTNSSSETNNRNVNDTMELKTVTEDEDKNSTSGRLENKTNQIGPSSAVLGGLIALLCFGMFFIIAIVVIFGKKMFESWQRRHYSRIDYLVNGMYN